MKYKVGDVVRVKTREELITSSLPSEYGEMRWRLKDDGWIVFVARMHQYCGGQYKVKEVFEDGRVYMLDGCDTWCFCDEMLKPGDDVDLCFDDGELSLMINEFKVL